MAIPQTITSQVWAIAVIWLYLAFGIFWLLQWWLSQHIQGLALLVFNKPGPASTIYFYLLAPGVIVHELSHWLFAKLLFVPTGDMALFRPNKNAPRGSRVTLGYVEVFRTDPLRQSIIGLAPLPVGVLILLLLAHLLGFNIVDTTTVITNNQMVNSLYRFPGELWQSLSQPVNVLWLYLVFTVSNGMLPSQPDRRPWLFGFILPSFILLVLTLTGNLHLPEDWQRSCLILLGTLSLLFAFAALINLLLALVIWLLESLVSRMRRRRVVYRR